MKRLDLIAFGETNQALIDALVHAVQQLKLGTPSENISWDDRSHLEFDVAESDDQEFREHSGEEE